jgi:hypothetical protein
MVEKATAEIKIGEDHRLGDRRTLARQCGVFSVNSSMMSYIGDVRTHVCNGCPPYAMVWVIVHL